MLQRIKYEADYQKALVRIETLLRLDAEAGSPEWDELNLLSTLVEKHEDIYFPINPPDPVEALRFRMEQEGKIPEE
jgi:HTH-type transcriptional regulator/antitoxin HigA